MENIKDIKNIKLENASTILKSEISQLHQNQARKFSNIKMKRFNFDLNHKKKEEEQEKEKQRVKPIVRYQAKYNQGLSNQQVQARQNAGLSNNTKITTSKSYLSIFLKNIFTFFNMIWLVIAVALGVVGAFQDMLFIVIVVANTAIAIIQEIRAKVTVEKLSMQTQPSVRVIREGEEVDVPSESLVLDDIIKLNNGNQIPADCYLVEGKVEVNESLLTGESNSVVKHKGDRLLSGSYIASGSCYARVDKVGKDNYMFQIAAKAREFKAPQSNLFKDINRLIKYIGIALIPIGVLTFLKEYNILGSTISTAIQNTSGSLTAMIPSGMFLLITISLAVGVVKLAKKKTLVRDLYSIEMLSRTNVLCLDKTGTITDGTMNVVEFETYSKQRKSTIKNILSSVLYNQKSSNATSNALIKEFGLIDTIQARNTIEFSSERKYSVTELDTNKIYFLGAASFIRCKLTQEQKDFIADASSRGLRVVALAEKTAPFSEKINGEDSTVLALIVLEEHIRKDAIETIKWFKENGVQIKIISGDDPATVSKIASRVGVADSDKYVSLESFSLKEVEQMADQFTVFGRVTPEQKYTIIKSLKTKGNVVSMTGDGVNDSLALKEADCSIAMADGSEVARNISKIVLLDSNFSSLPAVVKEGRQVVNNVQNSSALYLMKTFFAIILSLTTLLFGMSYPFTPRMMFLIEFFIIGIPSFLLTFEPNSNQIKGNFIPQVMKRALPRSLLMLINILLIVFLSAKASSPFTAEEVNTVCVLTLTYTGLINLITLCWPFSIMKGIAVGLSSLALILTNILMPEFFNMTSFTTPVMITFFALIFVSIVVLILIKVNKNSINRLKQKIIRLLQKTDE